MPGAARVKLNFSRGSAQWYNRPGKKKEKKKRKKVRFRSRSPSRASSASRAPKQDTSREMQESSDVVFHLLARVCTKACAESVERRIRSARDSDTGARRYLFACAIVNV